jgi:hypothetical protein
MFSFLAMLHEGYGIQGFRVTRCIDFFFLKAYFRFNLSLAW